MLRLYRMDMLSIFVVSVLDASAIASSAYVTVAMACRLAGKRNDTLQKQMLGFILLFFSAILVYMVI